MVGISLGDPYWHQPTHSSPEYTRIWWTVPARTCACLASRFCVGVLSPPTPSGWKPMHQQPPQTPLFASTSLAKSAHVSAVNGRVAYADARVWSVMSSWWHDEA